MSTKLFEAVRKACPPAIWSRGIDLTRADAVVGESLATDEAVFRVSTRGGMICPTVTLFLDDLDWDCDCSSRDEACEHVAAAVIAWRRSIEQGGGLPAPRHEKGRVRYRFTRQAGSLALERTLVHDDGEQPLEVTLVALAEGRVPGPRILATQEDLAVELALGTHRRGVLAAPSVTRVFGALARCSDVLLDDEPIRVSSEPLSPVACVRDRGEGFELIVVPARQVSETFANGIVRCDDTLRFRGVPQLTARERRDLERGRVFAPDALAELLTEWLPSLRKRMPVEIRTERLPQTVDERPRVLIDVEREADTLAVLATLVYGDPPLARIDGGRLVHLGGAVPVRNEKAERIELRRLARLGLTPGVRAEFSGIDAVAFNARLEDFDGRVRGAGRDHFRVGAMLEPRCDLEADRFGVEFRTELDPGDGRSRPRQADPAAVLRAWRDRQSLVPLLGGGWAPLPTDWLERYGTRIADLLAARDEAGRLPRWCLGDLASLCEDLDEPPPADFESLRELVSGQGRIPEVVLPEDLTAELRPYQRQGVDWLSWLRDARCGAMLADDMGLGKTLQTLCVLGGRTLVVAPTSVLHNWLDEIRKHRPGLTTCVYHGPGRALDAAADATLTTYAILRLDVDTLAAERWDTVVLDEAQQIKNPESQVAAAAFRLDADFRVTLSGTPVENRLDELWSQFHFLNRGLLGGRSHFRECYADPIAAGADDAADRLRARIRPFLLRRLKKDVAADLPPRTEMVLRCELSAAERDIYDSIRAATLDDVVRQLGSGGGVMAALEALLRLRQASCHGSLIPGHTVDESSKLRLLLDSLDTVVADGHSALVFSQWTSLLDLTEPLLRSAGIDFARLDGATRDRRAVVERFQRGEVPLMLISLKAGGTGLNLTAADHIFLLDPWWNPAVEDQAADRAHRIGQRRPVMVYRLVAMDTVEERILTLQQSKRDLAALALDGAAGAAGLTREDLLDLLG